jgi:hypothetical protein
VNSHPENAESQQLLESGTNQIINSQWIQSVGDGRQFALTSDEAHE